MRKEDEGKKEINKCEISSIRMRRKSARSREGGRNRREAKFNGKTRRRNKYYVGIFQFTCS